MNDISVIDGVKITTDENGNQFFELIDDSKPIVTYSDNRSFWQKLKDWWNNSNVKPYATVRNLSDPIGKRKSDPFDDGSGSKSAIEIGIKIDF